MSLEDALRALCEKNAGVTLWRTAEGQWQAGATRDRVSWRVETRDDPVTAVLAVCGVAPKPEPKGVFD